LFRLIQPALDRYRGEHRDEITPTDAEVEFAAAYFVKADAETWEERQREGQQLRVEEVAAEFDALLAELPTEGRGKAEALRERFIADRRNPAGRFARWMLETRKFQRHLYEKFGGGRVLFQQAGVEAFDATRLWLETLEAKGDFRLSDPKLREELYRYWTGTNHGAFLSTPEKNPDAIEEFMNPAWFPAAAAPKP